MHASTQLKTLVFVDYNLLSATPWYGYNLLLVKIVKVNLNSTKYTSFTANLLLLEISAI